MGQQPYDCLEPSSSSHLSWALLIASLWAVSSQNTALPRPSLGLAAQPSHVGTLMPERTLCDNFIYGGCRGNKNNYRSKGGVHAAMLPVSLPRASIQDTATGKGTSQEDPVPLLVLWTLILTFF